MARVYILILMIFFSLFTSCGEKQKDDIKLEKYFTDSVEKCMQNLDKFETDLGNLVKFKWDSVCFVKGNNLLLKFHNSQTKIQHTIRLPKNYNIEENYVRTSPLHEYYENKTLHVKKCWEKGTLFIIKKWDTIDKNDLLIQIKGE